LLAAPVPVPPAGPTVLPKSVSRQLPGLALDTDRAASAPPGLAPAGRPGPGRGRGRSCPAEKGKGRGGGLPRDVRISKALSQVLRHTAASRGLLVRPDGFVRVAEVLGLRELQVLGCSAADVRDAVDSNEKKRFDLVEEGGELLIRATQGHSMKVVSDDQLLRRLSAADPDLPGICVHGTYMRHLQSILQRGLLPGGGASGRNHVHFAPFEPGDGRVISGMRASCEAAVYVDLRRALADGVPFFLSTNQVLLSPGVRGAIPSKYISGVKHVQTGQWLSGGS